MKIYLYICSLLFAVAVNAQDGTTFASNVFVRGLFGSGDYIVARSDGLLMRSNVSAAISSTQWVTAAVGTLTATNGVTYGHIRDSNNVVVCIGDSITEGGAGGATAYPPQLSTVNTIIVYNAGRGGSTTTDLITYASTNSTKFYSRLARNNIAVVWIGTNDDGTGHRQTLDRASAFCRQLQVQGFKVIFVTMLSRSGSEVFKTNYNNLIRVEWPSFANALADVSANPVMGGDAAYADTTYFVDGVHPTTLGMAISATNISKVIDFVITNSPQVAVLGTMSKLAVGTPYISQTNRINTVDIRGSATIGTNYSQTAAPANGIIIQGNVGLGNSNPIYPLDVADTMQVVGVNPYIILKKTGSTTASGSLHFYGSDDVIDASLEYNKYVGPGMEFNLGGGSAGVRMFISTAGAVGIGTKVPASSLDVTGQLRVASAIMTNALSLLAGAGTTGSFMVSSDTTGSAMWTNALYIPILNVSTGNFNYLNLTNPPSNLAQGGSGAIQFAQVGALAGTNIFIYNRTNSSVDIYNLAVGNGMRINGGGIVQLGDDADLAFGVGVTGTNWIIRGGAGSGALGSFWPTVTNAYDIGSHLLPVRTNWMNNAVVKQGLSVGSIGSTPAVITNTLVGLANLDFPSTAAGVSSDLPITVTGCTSNNCHVSLSVPWEAASGGGSFSHFESNDTVYVRFSNNQLVAAIDPNPATFSALIFKVK